MKTSTQTTRKLTILLLATLLVVALGVAMVLPTATSFAKENTGMAIPGGSFPTTDNVWEANATTSNNLIVAPTNPMESSVADTYDESYWQGNWNLMVAAGWGSKWISLNDDALQVYKPISEIYTWAIRPRTKGTTGTNAALGGAGDAPDKYTGGVSYTVKLSDADVALANASNLKTQANAGFYRQESQYYYHAITIEFFDADGDKIDSQQKRWSATILGGKANGYLARSYSGVTVPANTQYIRYWFCNYGSGDARKSVANMEAYLVNTADHTHDFSAGICSCGQESFITFESDSTFSIAVSNNTKGWAGKIEYSTDLTTWTEWTGTTLSTINSSADGTLYMRGDGNTVITGSATNKWVLNATVDVSCHGNIMTLLDYDSLDTATMGDYAFAWMFNEWTKLTSAPELPATTLSKNCYQAMFYNCRLTTAPELPATTLANECYHSMFYGNKLTTAPELPATTLANGCYLAMFQACTELTALPSLPATTLVENCYNSMFKNCSALKLSETQTVDYAIEWKVDGTADQTATNWNTTMFESTGGTFTGAPTAGTIYYLAGEHIHSDDNNDHLCDGCGNHVSYDETNDWVEWTAWTATDNLPTTAGHYYLANNVSITNPDKWSVSSGEITLCLNGKSIATESKNMISGTDTNITLCDCQGSGTITTDATSNANGYIFEITSGATVNCYDITVDIPSGLTAGFSTDTTSVLNIYSGTYNSATRAVLNQGTFNMYGGNIVSTSGGVSNGGTCNISGNSSIVGAGEVVTNSGTLTISGGTVKETGAENIDNYAISSRGTKIISGTSQISSVNNGAVYLSNSAKLYLSDAPTITGKRVDISLYYSPTIYAQSNDGTVAYSGNDLTIEIITENSQFNEGSAIVKNVTQANQDKFILANAGYTLALGSGENANNLVLTNAHVHADTNSDHTCDDDGCGMHVHSDGNGGWIELTEWTAIDSLPASGSYYLANDVKLEQGAYIALDATVCICLNGKTLDLFGFTLTNNGNLTITDLGSNTGSVHTKWADDYTYSAIINSATGNLILDGVNINHSVGNGSTIENAGTLVVSNSTLTTATAAPIDVDGENAIATVTNSTLTQYDSKDYSGYGIYVSNSGTLKLTNSSVTSQGTAIYLMGNKNATITNSNLTSVCALYVSQDGVATVDGGSLTATSDGDSTVTAVDVSSSAQLTLKGEIAFSGDCHIDFGFRDTFGMVDVADLSLPQGVSQIIVGGAYGYWSSGQVILHNGADKLDWFVLQQNEIYEMANYTLKAGEGENANHVVFVSYVAKIDSNYYGDLQEAIDDATSGQTITLLRNVTLSAGLVVAVDDNITIDLNGCNITYTSSTGAADALITNNGTLTLTNGKSSGGYLTFTSTTPSSANAYGTHTISNCGTLTIEKITVKNTSATGASYAIDNNSSARNAILTINSGTITAPSNNYAIRQFANSNTSKNDLIVTDGSITGGRSIWLQLPSGAGNKPLASINISGGTFSSVIEGKTRYCILSSSNGCDYDGVVVNISGGTFDSQIAFGSGYAKGGKGTEKVRVTGGNLVNVWSYLDDHGIEITGGNFTEDPNKYDDYVHISACNVYDESATTYKYSVVAHDFTLGNNDICSRCGVHLHANGDGTADDVYYLPTATLPTSAGNYYLTADVTAEANWDVTAEDITLCLCGNNIELGQNTITVTGATLVIDDCKQTGAISVDVSNDLATIAVSINDNATLVLNGGTIKGAVEVDSVIATFNMTGGSIIQEATTYAVSNRGNFVMSGGTITSEYTGVSTLQNSTFTMSGGTITGKIYGVSAGGAFTMSGTATIQNCITGLMGDQYSTITLLGGSVINNTISVQNATNSYGGIYSAGELKIDGSVTIYGNKYYTQLKLHDADIVTKNPIIFGENFVNANPDGVKINVKLTSSPSDVTTPSTLATCPTGKASEFMAQLNYVDTTTNYVYLLRASGDDIVVYKAIKVTVLDEKDGNVIETIYGAYNDLLNTPSTPTKAGFTLEGWYNSADDQQIAFNNYKYTADMEIYANWNLIGLSYSYLNAKGVGKTVYDGKEGQISVEWSHPLSANITYQWYVKANGADDSTYAKIDGATNNVLAILDAQNNIYKVVSTLTVDGYQPITHEWLISVNIAPKTVNIYWDDVHVTYNGADQKDSVKAWYYDVESNKIFLAVTTPTQFENVNQDGYLFTVAGFATDDTGSSNYQLHSELSKTFYIDPLAINNATITLGKTLNYTGSEQTAEVVKVQVGDLVLPEDSYVVSGNTQTEVGAYTLTVTASGNFTGTATATWMIDKGNVDMSSIFLYDITYQYNGAVRTVTVGGVIPSGITISYKYNGEAVDGVIDVGEHIVTVSFAVDQTRYNAIPDRTVKLTITQAQAVITVDTKPIVVNEGATLTLPTATSNFGTVVVDKVVADLAKAGVYEVTYSVAGTNNYLGASAKLSVTVNHVLGQLVAKVDATCSATGTKAHYKCTQCDTLFDEDKNPTTAQSLVIAIDANAHSWGEWTVTTPATCVAKGVETRVCSLDATHTETRDVAIDSDAHDIVNHDAKAPTCTEIGWNAYQTCSRCDHTTYVELPAVGAHSYGELIAEVPATCSATGTLAHYECSACNKLFVKVEDAYVEKTADELVIAVDTDAHAWGEWSQTKAPTCSAKGEETRICAINGEHTDTKDVEIDENAHAWGEWTVTTPATCIAEGEKTRACAHNDEHKDTEAIPVDTNAHDVVNHDAKAPTCTQIGWNAYQTCSRCDYTTYVELPADKSAHDLTTVGAKAPTCTESGHAEYQACQREGCGYSTYVEKVALGHDFSHGNWIVEEETHHKQCARCDVTSREVAHEYVDGVCECGKEQEETNMLWLIITLGGVSIGEAIMIFLKLKKGSFKAKSVVGFALLGALPQGQLPLIIILGILVVGLGGWMAILYTRKEDKRKTHQQPSQSNYENGHKAHVELAIEQPKQDAVASVAEVAVSKPLPQTLPQSNFTVAGKPLEEGKIAVRYNRSFLAKLAQADDGLKQRYVDIVNYLQAFKGAKARTSWKAVTFANGRKVLAKLTIKGKTLSINLALQPADCQDLKFKVVDDSQTKSLAKVPTRLKVRSARGVKNAFKLIDKLAEGLQLTRLGDWTKVSVAQYPFQTIEELVDAGLIKVKDVNGKAVTDLTNTQNQPFAIHQSVTVQQAKAEMTDDVAKSLVVATSGVKSVGKKFAVNVDILSANFENGDTVDIRILKQKGIVPKKEQAVKILARGLLDKQLTVIADDYSADAIKMIVLVGGTAKLR